MRNIHGEDFLVLYQTKFRRISGYDALVRSYLFTTWQRWTPKRQARGVPQAGLHTAQQRSEVGHRQHGQRPQVVGHHCHCCLAHGREARGLTETRHLTILKALDKITRRKVRFLLKFIAILLLKFIVIFIENNYIVIKNLYYYY